MLTIGSLSNNDGDGNENGKLARGVYHQNNNFACVSRFFCTLLSRGCTTETCNFLISSAHFHKTPS